MGCACKRNYYSNIALQRQGIGSLRGSFADIVIEESAEREVVATLEGNMDDGETKASVTVANARIAQAVPETWLIILSKPVQTVSDTKSHHFSQKSRLQGC
jgi:hypothetical protein